MANCKLSKNILKENACGYSLLKVTDVYLGNFADVETTVLSGEVTAVTGIFYHIEPSKDSASFTDELQVTDSGAKYRTQTLNFSVDAGNYNAELAANVDDISLGRYVAVAKLSNGNRVMLGRVVPLEATVSTITGAASATDSNPIQFTLVADTNETAVPVKSDVVLPSA